MVSLASATDRTPAARASALDWGLLARAEGTLGVLRGRPRAGHVPRRSPRLAATPASPPIVVERIGDPAEHHHRRPPRRHRRGRPRSRRPVPPSAASTGPTRCRRRPAPLERPTRRRPKARVGRAGGRRRLRRAGDLTVDLWSHSSRARVRRIDRYNCKVSKSLLDRSSARWSKGGPSVASLLRGLFEQSIGVFESCASSSKLCSSCRRPAGSTNRRRART